MNVRDPADAVGVEARAAGFTALLRERAREIENTRYLPSDISRAFAEAGLYRLAIPREYGGYEADPMTFLRVVETLATADASAAWCVFIHVTSTLSVVGLPPAAASEIVGHPLATVCGVYAPRGFARVEGDGYCVDGCWSWGSGIRNAQWVAAGCVLTQDGRPIMGPGAVPTRVSVFVPVDRVRILDTWHVSGLCGTGSNDFEIVDCRVPRSHVAGPIAPAFAQRPLYRFPLFGLLSSPIAAVCLGLARAAMGELRTLALNKTPDGSTRSLANRPTTQIEVAKAEASVRAARGYLYESVEAAYRGPVGSEPTVEDRLHVRLATTHAVKTCAEAVDAMYRLAGGSALYSAAPIQRLFRDVHAATQHMMVGSATLELTGRLLLGLETNTAGL
jgi:alkylation response protein AidB-like acyl-CoA dehydrogenase